MGFQKRIWGAGFSGLDGPLAANIHLSLSNWFQLTERATAQFRWETFNTTNHTNLRLPAVTLDKSNAGSITKTNDSRVMQFGLRLEF
jgi:hypothetical protein